MLASTKGSATIENMPKLKLRTISIQGQLASFSHQAANNLGTAKRILQRDDFRQVFEDLTTGQADLIIVPIENSTYGSVYENYDLLSRYDCQIVAETYVRVRLHLLGLPTAKLSEIEKIYSHQIALDQIQNFRSQQPHLKFIPYQDTAGAAAMIKAKGDARLAACAGDQVQATYGLKMLQASIEDNARNFTRFFALTRPGGRQFTKTPQKTTIQFELGSEAGLTL